MERTSLAVGNEKKKEKKKGNCGSEILRSDFSPQAALVSLPLVQIFFTLATEITGVLNAAGADRSLQ